jgi:3',5'-cyclic AMP phosphodiesterase CpdA
MPTLIHLSDLHFGSSHNSRLDDIILAEIEKLDPDVVIVSGDLTMRARHREYAQARRFLRQISKPLLTIPGNHDQPIFQPVERFTRQFARYQQYVHPDIDSVLLSGGLFVLGLNDNHPILPGGFWSSRQRAWIAQQLTSAPRDAIKVIVTHHQLLWDGRWRPAGFWCPTRALEFLARHGVEIALNGHTHVPAVERTPQGIVVARAGTASSRRTRHGNTNAYNLIAVDGGQITVFVRRYDERADAFVAERASTFPRRTRRDS